MKTTDWRVATRGLFHMRSTALLVAASVIFGPESTFADGCFVFRWNKKKDISEPTQKAIVFHDQNREDLILQVKYEGPAEHFGWIIPVPGQPEVRKGSMEPFYELSRITQKQFRDGEMKNYAAAGARGHGEDDDVKVIEIKTVGKYEVAILSSTNPSALADWLAAHHFIFPKEKQSVLDAYTQRHWFFVAARINPEADGFVVNSAIGQPAPISEATRKELASGELHPIIISFPTDKCIFPLAISSVNGTPSEISLYVLSAEPMLSPVVFDRKFKAYKAQKEKWLGSQGDRQKQREQGKKSHQERMARIFRDSPLAARMKAEDPNDPPPALIEDFSALGAHQRGLYEDLEGDYCNSLPPLVRSMSVDAGADSLKSSSDDLPRMKGKQWWLTKLVETFPPEDMVDLEFVYSMPFLGDRMRREDGETAARCLPQYGATASQTVYGALVDSDAAVRGRALLAAAEMTDRGFVDPVLKLMENKDPVTRLRACNAAEKNWNEKFEKALLRLLYDPEPGLALIAQSGLFRHAYEINLDAATLHKAVAEDGPASLFALQVLQIRKEVSRNELAQLLSSTNLAVVSSAFNALRDKIRLEEITALMTNSIPLARFMALGALTKMADKPAVERIVSMLHDSNDAIRWRVRSALRRLTGQKLGADPAAYETWWAANRNTYVPLPPQPRSRPR